MHSSQANDVMIRRQIAVRAYGCWERRGRPFGSPEVDWRAAVEDLKHDSERSGPGLGVIQKSAPAPEIAKMSLDKALESAVVASWGELIHPGEAESNRVEYQNTVPLDFLEVWMVKNRGYGTLICRYSPERSESKAGAAKASVLHFANSYGSKTLAANLHFIFRNLQQFTRSSLGFVHGLVLIEQPSV
jgi:hypothetical protein